MFTFKYLVIYRFNVISNTMFTISIIKQQKMHQYNNKPQNKMLILFFLTVFKESRPVKFMFIYFWSFHYNFMNLYKANIYSLKLIVLCLLGHLLVHFLIQSSKASVKLLLLYLPFIYFWLFPQNNTYYFYNFKYF